ncbi:PREDICTED: uncharacterized protein LOC107331928 isoform X3 [Acropora digitifera]|uniref:uncharacterized protein LOC107331928 isoform X3 n=1 Tax=Acropora digitifera TaxID=70779 RepID=UPI00077AA95C|nr:PREDICTED: uncharacterized protein LOC107331928 isoform X3 [Acropora digitifera]
MVSGLMLNSRWRCHSNTVSSSNEVLSSFVIYAQMKHNSSMNMAMTIKGLGTDKADLLEGNKMADEGKSLDELIEEAEALLELEKPRKRKKGESEFEFYCDSLTGHRTTKHKYRPRCRRPTSQSTATCTSNSLKGSSFEASLWEDNVDSEDQSSVSGNSNESWQHNTTV